MADSHYSLRWNNHQHHVLNKFSDLLRSESFVDVTLYCENNFSLRAHKIVLSACSPYFEKLFGDNPCKHTIVILHNFSKWELQAIVKFIYDGEVSVAPDQLDRFMKVADTLCVRGLTNPNSFDIETSPAGTDDIKRPNSALSPQECDRAFGTPAPPPSTQVAEGGRVSAPFPQLPPPNFDVPNRIPGLPHHHSHHHLQHHLQHHLNPSELARIDSQSPLPRRKQARPRRRSGEMCAPQDLTVTSSASINSVANKRLVHPDDEVAENLCIKKNRKDMHSNVRDIINLRGNSPEMPDSPELDLSTVHHHEKHFSPDHSPSLGLPPILSMHHELDSHAAALPFTPMPSVSALAMATPHNKYFGLDSPLGLFPPGLDRNPLLELTDPRNTPEPHLFAKKKMGRPKGQHSAPRGGPPRSWTNHELTQALAQVWNKQMTTSQASRCFGIPYNSLLMYVRGKYGKSLKLEQLRKDITILNGGGNQDLKAPSNNNNSMCKPEPRDNDPLAPRNTSPSNREQVSPPQPPLFSPFGPNMYPDFVANFPIPVNLVHLLPQSENNRDHYSLSKHQSNHQAQSLVQHPPPPPPPPSHQQLSSQLPPSHNLLDDESNTIRSIKLEQDQQQDLYKQCEERRDYQQQNGQD